MMAHTERVIVLVDMDCFYCQVEEKLNPSLKGKPVAVVQYNAWKGGGLIAVNYQARDCGVTRHMRGDEAKKNCPSIELVRVPNVRGKADLTKYRDAGKLVAKVLQSFTPLLERASVDEAYLDITEVVKQRMQSTTKDITLNELKNSHVVNCDTIDFLYNLYNSGLYEESNMKLAFGGVIVEEIRAAVFEQTGYTCSAGIAHNKILAKLACGFNKPNKQTILPQDNIQELYKELPIRKIRSLGGKFGDNLSEDLGITKMAELVQFSMKELTKRYDEKNASFLYNIARGIDNNPVTIRLVSKSIGCCKKFPGKSALVEEDSVKHWLTELALEITERLDEDLHENNRKAKQIVISYSKPVNGKDVSSSRTCALNSYDTTKLVADAYKILRQNCLTASGTFCIKFLGLSAGKFDDCSNVNEITSFFKVDPSNKTQTDTANFSDSTEDLNETSSELVFLNENSNENKSDSDSISGELASDNLEPKKSFFLNYFENVKKEQERPVLRDFNTSRNLEEHVESDEELFPEETSSSFDAIPGTSRETVQPPKDCCSECHKKIPASEMVSHMDYHYALKIVRDEADLYKRDPPQQVKKDVKKSSKRKTVVEMLAGFVETDSTEGILCPECSKKVALEDIASHTDYHAAKKLHLEINAVKSCAVETLNKNPIVSRKGKKIKDLNKQGVRSVSSFFKRAN